MSAIETIDLPIGQPYTFAASVCDHGWPRLAPFRWDDGTQTLERIEQLPQGEVILLQIHTTVSPDQVMLHIDITSAQKLTERERAQVVQSVRWMLKLDRDYQPFYQLAAQHEHIGRVVSQGRGRLLRSPTLWEDVVKTIATTNVSWRNTVAMIERLVSTLGTPFPLEPKRRAFPTPHQVADADPALFAETIRMGYRNAYVQQLAHEIIDGKRNLEALQESTLSTIELKKRLKSIKGIGDYAAHTLLMLLGHYGELPIDSEYRSFVTRQYFGDLTNTQAPTDKQLAAIYDDWAEWKYLAYWFDHYD